MAYHRQQLLAKPGSGDFVAELEQYCRDYGSSVATIYRRIERYKAVRAGIEDILLVYLSQHEKDNPWGGVLSGVSSVEDFDELVGSDEADAKADALTRLVAAAKKRVEDAQQIFADKPFYSLTIRIDKLTKQDYEDLHAAHKKLRRVLGPDGFRTFISDGLIGEAELRDEPEPVEKNAAAVKKGKKVKADA